MNSSAAHFGKSSSVAALSAGNPGGVMLQGLIHHVMVIFAIALIGITRISKTSRITVSLLILFTPFDFYSKVLFEPFFQSGRFCEMK
jgi:hypothetical protein